MNKQMKLISLSEVELQEVEWLSDRVTRKIKCVAHHV